MKRPNIVFVLTDDQGYGELGLNGNNYIQTPNIDEFGRESLVLDDFHVAPLCAPSRGEIMTGNRAARNGVYATCWGRSILDVNEKILPEYLKDAGYVTGMFGKWHLGDNYPYRPHDRGFMHVVAHKGGGVGQTPDFWGNNYFDDTYFFNNEAKDYNGYCTDVWFDEAIKFIEHSKEQPFFAYIATNAPHAPYLVDSKYSNKYQDNEAIPEPEFYGMIECIDDNFGKLRRKLKELEIEDNTIIIFMTDNGSSGVACDEEGFVVSGFNGGMRGKKNSYYEGGHRVPFLIRWPEAGIIAKDDIKINEKSNIVDDTCLGIDLLPTLLELCQVEDKKVCDGESFANLLLNRNLGKEDQSEENLVKCKQERIHFLQVYQSTFVPEKNNVGIMYGDWRYIFGTELYNIKNDPKQLSNVIDEYPEIVAKIEKEYDIYWQEVEPKMHYLSPIYLGDAHENPTRLDSMDVRGDVAWSQIQVANAVRSCGTWTVKICETGRYEFRLKRWPDELGLELKEELSQQQIEQLAKYGGLYKGLPVDVKEAYIEINNRRYKAKLGIDEAIVECELNKCDYATLKAKLVLSNHEIMGAYYVYVKKIKC